MVQADSAVVYRNVNLCSTCMEKKIVMANAEMNNLSA